MSAFEEIGICPEIIKAIEEEEWHLPTAVQHDAIPLIMTGGDVCVAAETGSGKTGAFGIPCLQIVHEQLRGRCQTNGVSGSNKKCQLSEVDKDLAIRIERDGLECKSDDDKRWCGVRATHGVLCGKYIFEVEVIHGLVRVGWSAEHSALELGIESRGFGYGSTGKKSQSRKFEDYGETYRNGDIIGCLLDRENHVISFAKNGKDLGVAYSIPEALRKVGLKPHVCGKKFAAAVNFDGPLEYELQGFRAVGQIDPAHTSRPSEFESGVKRLPKCLVLEPTRDLADQTHRCMAKFCKYLEDPPVRIGLFVGGTDEQPQLHQLDRGVDICVGTLQKVMDYVKRSKLDLSQINFLVLDEADDLQKKDEKKDIAKLNSEIKDGRKDRVQTLFFSATLHTPAVASLIKDICSRPQWVDLKGKDSVPDTVHHVVYHVDPNKELKWSDTECASRAKFPEVQPKSDGVHRRPSLSDFDREKTNALKLSDKIKKMKPKIVLKIADAFAMTQVLVFCRTNWDCDNLESYFCELDGQRQNKKGKFESGKENPYSCAVLAGSRSQKERAESLQCFKEGDVRFLICTDVAARGIDISSLPFVIQMTLSDDIELYLHRIGRCGRADRLGLCVSLVAIEKEKMWYFKNKQKRPENGSSKLTCPFGTDGKLKSEDKNKWIVEEDGDTIWYDELDLMDKIENRIGQDLQLMDIDDFSVDGVIESPLPVGERKNKDVKNSEAPSRRGLKRKSLQTLVQTYGTKKSNTNTDSLSKYANAIEPTVRHLCALEEHVQQLFAKAMWGVTDFQAASVPQRPDISVRLNNIPETKKSMKKVRW